MILFEVCYSHGWIRVNYSRMGRTLATAHFPFRVDFPEHYVARAVDFMTARGISIPTATLAVKEALENPTHPVNVGTGCAVPSSPLTAIA